MAQREDSPWLRIPAEDYEAHMAEIGQSTALRDIFSRAYAETRPRRLLILGCTTGRDFELVEPAVTEKSVGVDVNPEYLETARSRVDRLGQTAELIHGDVLHADLPASEFDLIYAALLFEYVDPAPLLRRIGDWLAPNGACWTVTQNPAEGIASVSRTGYESLRVLDGNMSLRGADEMRAVALRAGLEGTATWDVPLPLGKSFSVSTFRKARAVQGA